MTIEQELEELRSLMQKVFYYKDPVSTDQPTKHELIRGIVFALRKKLAKLSYEDVQQFAEEFKLLEDK